MLLRSKISVTVGVALAVAAGGRVVGSTVQQTPSSGSVVVMPDSVRVAAAAPAVASGRAVSARSSSHASGARGAAASPEPRESRESGEDWDFQGSRLTERELRPWLQNKRVQQVVYYDSETPQVFEPKRNAPAGKTEVSSDGSTLFVSTKKSVREYASERASDLGRNRGSFGGLGAALGTQLSEGAYELLRFDPGFLEDRKTRIGRPRFPDRAIQGPDYSLEEVDPREVLNPDSIVMADLKSRVLSLGHGGMVVLRVRGGGALIDGAGADFAVCENPFFDGPNLIHELGRVGIAESAGAQAVWFPCDPERGVRGGCAGIVPPEDGCDLFDLAEVGLRKAQYILIQDIGTNAFAFHGNAKISSGSEGFDLDALKLFHAYLQ